MEPSIKNSLGTLFWGLLTYYDFLRVLGPRIKNTVVATPLLKWQHLLILFVNPSKASVQFTCVCESIEQYLLEKFPVTLEHKPSGRSVVMLQSFNGTEFRTHDFTELLLAVTIISWLPQSPLNAEDKI
ncbi:hypothetical protein TNCV_1399071 [Trichonephila clavipes]|nr:hypothetical protein TNCV_1399071 [Trichonephila clavipes]